MKEASPLSNFSLHHKLARRDCLCMKMLLFYATVFCVLFGGSFTQFVPERICYGGKLKLPLRYTPPLFNGKLYLHPIQGSTRVLMEKGKSKDPRLQVSIGSVEFIDLTERDEGGLSISYYGDRPNPIIQLMIKDCGDKVMEYYGNIFSRTVPRQAEFLEFIPLRSVDQPIVLWNRTNDQINKGGRGQMKRESWEINGVIPADMGHYNFRAKDHTLLSRILLEVNAHRRHYYVNVNERLQIDYLWPGDPWTVTFTGMDNEPLTLFAYGYVDRGYDSLTKRIRILQHGFQIDPVQISDNGTFEFRARDGNLAQIVEVEVEVTHKYNTLVYIGIGVGILMAVIVCCCCVRKCCCKKNSSAPQTAPPLDYHHIDQPAHPSFPATPAQDYSHANRYSRDSPVPRGRATIPLEPSVNNPLNIHVNPLQPEVAPVGGQGVGPALSIGSDCLSSDPQPRFELKGVPSAPPLSSDSSFSNVYTSDKLNFISTNEHIGN